MADSNGLFIVLEGSDGAGKNTQFNLLKERLKATGYDVAVFDFPRYSKESSYFVKRYLAGAYGPATELSPYTASLFYAMDRYEASRDIRRALDEGKIVLSNRFAGSNMAHQGAKFTDPVEQRGFFVWADNLEFQLLNIPRPDVSYFLRVPADVSRRLIQQRAAKTGVQLDDHEADFKFLKKSLATYDTLCRLFPKDFKAIECSQNGGLLSVAEINNLIWEQLKPLLPAKRAHASHSVVVSLTPEKIKQRQTADSSDVLVHNVKDASLLLYLHLLRLPHAGLSPDFKMWADHKFEAYTPDGLPKTVARQYTEFNEWLAASHQKLQQMMVKYLEAHLLGNRTDLPKESVSRVLLAITPLSARMDLELTLKKSDIQPVAGNLLTSDAAELQWTAKQIYMAARQKWPDEFDQPLESKDGPVPLNNIISKLAEERLPQAFSADAETKLLEVRPRLEFDLLAESIYPFSTLSLDEIAEEVSGWPYLQKYDSLKEAAAQPDTLKKVRYKLDILSDQISLDEILSAGQLKEVQVQAFTPRYGYDTPQIVETAAADDLFDTCFDESLKLYSVLQGAGREDLAAYVTLMGHKVRWQLNLDASQLQKVIKAEGLSGNRIIDGLSEKIAEVHPLLWEVMRGSNELPVAPARNGKSRVKAGHKRANRRGNRKKS